MGSSRKPSQLLHAMLEFSRVGMEKHLSFPYFFLSVHLYHSPP
jgi:hypothetical protein